MKFERFFYTIFDQYFDMLQVNNISFAYKKETVLHEIDFSIAKGECLAIAGESGSGKSTLLKLIYGEYDLNRGTIFWKDQEVLGPKHNLITGPDYMKYVSQEFDLMPFTTVENNIGKFLSNFYLEEKQQRIDELVQVVELENVAKTKVRYLSGGQKQRVALARAFANSPSILFADEPTGNLDEETGEKVIQLLLELNKEAGTTLVIISHDLDLANRTQQILRLKGGQILTNERTAVL